MLCFACVVVGSGHESLQLTGVEILNLRPFKGLTSRGAIVFGQFGLLLNFTLDVSVLMLLSPWQVLEFLILKIEITILHVERNEFA